MTSIVEFYNRNQTEVNELVDKTYFELNLSTDPLAQIFPVVSYNTMDILMLDIVRKPTIATLVASADIPATKPVTTMDERILRKLGFGKKHEFDDKDFDAMRQMEMYLSSQGRLGASVVQDLKRYFFGMAIDMVPSIRQKEYMIMMKLSMSGSINYVDPLSNVALELTYPDTIPALLPAPLAGANAWSQAATAVGLTNLEAHADAIYDQFGMYPDKIGFRMRNWRELRNQASTKAAYVAMGINIDAASVPSVRVSEEALVALVKERTKVKNVVLMDAQYYEENKDNPLDPTPGHYLDDDYYVFFFEGNTVIASVGSPENNYVPGVLVAAEITSKYPLKEMLIGYERGIPVIKDSRKIAARKVN